MSRIQERIHASDLKSRILALEQDMAYFDSEFRETKDALEKSEAEDSSMKDAREDMHIKIEALRRERDKYRGTTLSPRTNIVQENDRIATAVVQAVAPQDKLLLEKDVKIQHLNSLIQDLVVDNDFFKHSNQDLEDKNEKLQAINQELETDKLELEERVIKLSNTAKVVGESLEKAKLILKNATGSL